MQLEQQDIKNLLALISKTTINGQEALTVALLQQKLQSLLEQPPVSENKTSNEK